MQNHQKPSECQNVRHRSMELLANTIHLKTQSNIGGGGGGGS